MDHESRLSRIETLWSVVRQAHDGGGPGTTEAQQLLLDQYGGAVRRYLLAALRDQDAADEVFQQFALKFLRGDFEKADPTKGRFRQFVKTVVYRLVIDFQRRHKRDHIHTDIADVQSDGEPTASQQMDLDFTTSWRAELLARAWAALAEVEETTEKPYHTVLRFRADNPTLRSADVATALTKKLGREIKAGNARVLVHRAREIFAGKLLDLVEESLTDRAEDELENELITLDLLAYCRPALEARRGKKS